MGAPRILERTNSAYTRKVEVASRQGAGGGGRGAQAAEGVEHLGDDGGLGEHGADGELSAATNTNAKVNLEGSFQEGTPIETRARRVELAFEDSVPVGDRQDVRREVLGEAVRRQRSSEAVARRGTSSVKAARPSPASRAGRVGVGVVVT